MENNAVTIFINFIQGFGTSLKDGFNNFVYENGVITDEFNTGMQFIVACVSISVVCFVLHRLFKRGDI